MLRDNVSGLIWMPTSKDLRMLAHNSRTTQNMYGQEHAWSEAFEHLLVSVAQLTLDGRVLSANGQMCELLGRPKRALLGKNLDELFVAEESWPEYKGAIGRLLAGEIPCYSIDMRAVNAHGNMVWVNIVFSLVREAVTNRPRSLTAVARDVTSLKQTKQELHDAQVLRDDLSLRMMNAQEADRARIARELHDDIGQSLAVLKVQMLRAGKPVSGHPEMMHASLKDLTANLQKIIDKVGHLSRDLHSSVLELLGLAVAVKSHCRECSEQLGIGIECFCDQPQEELDSVMALAFFRVLQEATHNIVKHSRANSVTVRLTRSDRDLNLEICDNGVGFDVEEARLAAGLGLISMRERIHLVGGSFEVSSSPGRGTRIMVSAPIAKQTP